jgi:phosphoglucosamine mutase
VGIEPNGLNINRGCGSTNTEKLKKTVVENHLDIGFAFDGDGDRCIAVDEKGCEVDGDKIMYILAHRLRDRGMLSDNTVVATIMSNSGFFKALERDGMKCLQTKVGDRFVYECMQKGDYSLGGEQSGHIIMRKYATTGDGILTAIMVCEELCDRKTTLSDLAIPLKLYPQYTKNVRVTDKKKTLENSAVKERFNQVRELIGENGRALLRESGTEPVVRIMIECEDEKMCRKYADMISDAMAGEGLVCG